MGVNEILQEMSIADPTRFKEVSQKLNETYLSGYIPDVTIKIKLTHDEIQKILKGESIKRNNGLITISR